MMVTTSVFYENSECCIPFFLKLSMMEGQFVKGQMQGKRKKGATALVTSGWMACGKIILDFQHESAKLALMRISHLFC